MTGFSPLVAVQGQIEQTGDRRNEIKRINFGPAVDILAAPTVTVTQAFHYIVPVGNARIQTILGGEEGDLLILLGDGTKLRDNDNITNGATLGPYPTMLVFDGTFWNV